MKKIMLINLLLLSIITSGYSNIKGENLQPKETSYKALENKVDSLINLQNKNKDLIYEQRIQQASETIANQNSLISGFSTLYTVITIVLALIGISLPILTYQFGIKPSQKALKEFQENADKQIGAFVINNRNKQIEQAILNITSNNPELKNNALNFLSLTAYEGFTNSQIDEMINLLYLENIDPDIKNSIAFTISSKKHPSSTNYFRKVLEENIQDQFNSAITYFKNINSFDYFDSLKKFIQNSDQQSEDYLFVSIYVSYQKGEALLNYLNYKPIVDSLKENSLISLKESINIYNETTWKINDEDFKACYLFQKVNEI